MNHSGMKWEASVVPDIPKKKAHSGLREDSQKLLDHLIRNKGNILKLRCPDKKECSRVYHRILGFKKDTKYGVKIGELTRRGGSVYVEVLKD